ncbi:MAG: transaldolase [Simkania sp.]|nr:transaldolase [Simkania sp.]
MNALKNLKIKIFADGADLKGIEEMRAKEWIKGFTTNPSLMRQAGVKDYMKFAKDALAIVQDKPISFEVFADDFFEMEEQALEIASWGPNVYVKIPVTNTKGQFAGQLIQRLSEADVKLNITALFTLEQVKMVMDNLINETPAIISIFAGRIADTGSDPAMIMQKALTLLEPKKNAELLWASPREVFNLIQADDVGCHIITVSNDLLKKVHLLGKDLNEFSLETVKMFYKDAVESDYTITCKLSQ